MYVYTCIPTYMRIIPSPSVAHGEKRAQAGQNRRLV